jgi:hypothetical protein
VLNALDPGFLVPSGSASAADGFALAAAPI